MAKTSSIARGVAAAVALATAGVASGAVTSVPTAFIGSLVARASGYHALYFEGNPGELQMAGCDLADRAVIVQADPGGPALLQLSQQAYAERFLVAVAVDGCSVIDTAPGSPTAPRIVRIALRGRF